MFDYLKRILTQEERKEISAEPPIPSETENLENKLQVATAALFVEIATADGDFSDDERNRIINTLQKEFSLTDQCVDDLIKLSEESVKDSISVYEFTSVLNDHFNRDEKIQLLNNLWNLVYTDGKLNKYEDRLIKIIGSTLNLDHKDIINSKLIVKQELRK
jgi:uncharacterized tellurite resistance protein B-like protein